MGVTKKTAGTALYERKYEGLRGVDFRRAGREEGHFASLKNMYVDYESDSEMVESIPGYRRLANTVSNINGIFPQRIGDGEEYLIVHAGTNLYRVHVDELDNAAAFVLLYIGLLNQRSRGACWGGYTIIADGSHLIAVDESGTAKAVDTMPYTPYLSLDGEDAEEINMLTNESLCRYVIKNYDRACYGTPELIYEISNSAYNYCVVSGIDENYSGDVYIPSYVYLGGTRYRVVEIDNSAFKNNTRITNVYTNDSLRLIGMYAFEGCTSLKKVVVANTCTKIEAYAFWNCASISELYLGTGLTELRVGCLRDCPTTLKVHFAGTMDLLSTVVGVEYLDPFQIITESVGFTYVVGLKINKRITEILDFKMNGAAHSYEFDEENSEIIMRIGDPLEVADAEITIRALVSYESFGEDYFSRPESESVTPLNAINGCRLIYVFDGRLFLSGNPALPGFVFYSSNALDASGGGFYFPASAFFVDGSGNYPVSSISGSGDELIVCKSGDGGTGSVFCHKAVGAGANRRYEIYYTHYGLPVFNSFEYEGDILFLCDRGLCTLERTSSGQRRTLIMSECVNPKLLKEDLSATDATVWQGYLVIVASGNIYLADRRGRRDGKYDWYFLEKIGGYRYDNKVYKYSPTAVLYNVHPTPHQKATGTIYSTKTSSGQTVYYVISNGKKYEIYQTEEYASGIFSPAYIVQSFNKLLFAGGMYGSLLLFNNDKRGVAPDSLKASEDFDQAEYDRLYGNRIHPRFYTFAGHAAPYEAATVFDDCDAPGLAKSTDSSSLSVKYKCFPDSKLFVKVVSDLGERAVDEINTDGTVTHEQTMHATLPLGHGIGTAVVNEQEKGWNEKQVCLFSDLFRSPIGIESISYRYKIRGRLKEKIH